ncbi:MAG: hypothetical protein A4E35_00546 [Methanoregula sp. PtaU1.Bin051]|nr:MAG: hypothetical protein A4E35_00546 [Methanoregula sp. PtaU1.Bin051]
MTYYNRIVICASIGMVIAICAAAGCMGFSKIKPESVGSDNGGGQGGGTPTTGRPLTNAKTIYMQPWHLVFRYTYQLHKGGLDVNELVTMDGPIGCDDPDHPDRCFYDPHGTYGILDYSKLNLKIIYSYYYKTEGSETTGKGDCHKMGVLVLPSLNSPVPIAFQMPSISHCPVEVTTVENTGYTSTRTEDIGGFGVPATCSMNKDQYGQYLDDFNFNHPGTPAQRDFFFDGKSFTIKCSGTLDLKEENSYQKRTLDITITPYEEPVTLEPLVPAPDTLVPLVPTTTVSLAPLVPAPDTLAPLVPDKGG